MICIGVLGQGRMGSLVAREVFKRRECKLAGILVRTPEDLSHEDEFPRTTSLVDLMGASDIVIDFTNADSTTQFARAAINLGKPFVSGTTGFSEGHRQELEVISRRIPLLLSPNMAVSFTQFKNKIVETTRLWINHLEAVTIYDEHHRGKIDKLSGSALALGEVITKVTRKPSLIEYESRRVGDTVGKHVVTFHCRGHVEPPWEHEVKNRSEFAQGAVQAALWLRGKRPGLYTMDNVLRGDHKLV